MAGVASLEGSTRRLAERYAAPVPFQPGSRGGRHERNDDSGAAKIVQPNGDARIRHLSYVHRYRNPVRPAPDNLELYQRPSRAVPKGQRQLGSSGHSASDLEISQHRSGEANLCSFESCGASDAEVPSI